MSMERYRCGDMEGLRMVSYQPVVTGPQKPNGERGVR